VSFAKNGGKVLGAAFHVPTKKSPSPYRRRGKIGEILRGGGEIPPLRGKDSFQGRLIGCPARSRSTASHKLSIEEKEKNFVLCPKIGANEKTKNLSVWERGNRPKKRGKSVLPDAKKCRGENLWDKKFFRHGGEKRGEGAPPPGENERKRTAKALKGEEDVVNLQGNGGCRWVRSAQ